MKIHVESVHEGQKNHKCNECEKVFSTAGNLKAHILRSHGGSSVYIEPTQTQVCPLKPNFEPTRTPSKSPNFKPVWSEMGQTQAQVCKNQISNPSEPRFVYHNPTTDSPKPSKNFEPRTHEIGSIHHYTECGNTFSTIHSERKKQQRETAEENLKLIKAADQNGYKHFFQDELKEKSEAIEKLMKGFAKVDQTLQESKRN